MNTIVQEDKIKFTSNIKACELNNQFMVIVLHSEPKTLKIRHLYDQSFPDLNTTYPHPITSIKLSDSNHMVVVDEMNQVDILYLQSTKELKLTSIKGFQKKQLIDIVIDNNFVAILTEGKLHILQLKESACISNSKCQAGGTPINGSFSGENLYVCFTDNTIKKWTKNSSGKFISAPEVINLKQQIIQIKAIRSLQKDYLICLSKEKSVTVLSEQGKVVDVLSYEGEFKTILASHQLLTIVSSIKQSLTFSMYFSEKQYNPQSSRLFFNKCEIYNRNAQYGSCKLLPISKKQWAAYSRRKGAKQLHPVTQLNQQTFCLIYGRLESDPSKLQVLKVDMGKILKKQRIRESSSKHIKSQQHQSARLIRHQKHPSTSETPVKQNPAREIPKEVHKQPPIRKVELSDNFLKAVEKIVDQRVSPLIVRISQIQQKLNQIESKVNEVSSEARTSKLYSTVLEKEVLLMFENKIVPKMEEYFQQIFSDLAQVFSHGIEYYSQKLMIETNLQKQTFRGLISHTLNATKDIVDATKSDLPYTLKIDESLTECVRKKDELLRKTEQLLGRVEKGPFSYKQNSQKESFEIREDNKRQKQQQKEKGNQKEKEKEKEKGKQTENEKEKEKQKEKKGKKTFVKSNIQ